MRGLADRERIQQVMEGLGRAAEREVRIFLVGGATAVLMGWRASTIDVDFVMQPEEDAILRAIPALKERLQVNLEIASPAHFIPVPPGWEDRSIFVDRIGRATFLHYDLYAQALAKVERSHRQDVDDVRAMIDRGLVERARALSYFDAIEPDLYRYPAIDPASFRLAVERTFSA